MDVNNAITVTELADKLNTERWRVDAMIRRQGIAPLRVCGRTQLFAPSVAGLLQRSLNTTIPSVHARSIR
jgi:hypothetical protein